MKKIILCLVLGLSALFAEQKAPCFEKADHRVYLGPEVYHLRFEPGHANTFCGALGGFVVGYTYRPADYLFAEIENNYTLGRIDGRRSEHRDINNERLEGKLGYTFATGRNQSRLFTLFAGLGYSNIRNKLKEKGLSPVTFRYIKYFVPLGFSFYGPISQDFDIGMRVQAMPSFDTTVKISGMKGSRWVLLNKVGVNIEMPFTWKIKCNNTLCGDLQLIPFWEWNKDGGSTARTSSGVPLGLPPNHYIYWGVKLTGGIKF